MSTFKHNDRVLIDKDLTYTAPKFGVASEMREIFTGTVKCNYFQNDDEVTVMLDYPDTVPERDRISYSYDPRDLTLISRPTKFSHFKLKDRVKVDSLKHTKERFGIVEKMSEILTGTVDYVDEALNEVQLKLDGDDENVYLYDPRDLTLIPNENEEPQKGNAMPKLKKNDKVVIDKTLKYTKKRFSLVCDMKSTFTGVIKHIDEDRNKATVTLDGSHNNWTYDLRDLTSISNGFPTPTNVKTSNEKTTVEFSDGSKTSVKKSAGDPYDLETAIAYCIAKKFVTNSYIKHLAKTAEEVLDKVNTEFYNKFLKPYGFLNENAYTDVEIETLKDYLKTLNDVRSEMALIAIENDLTKDELFNKLKG